jgi:hypothetical protein
LGKEADVALIVVHGVGQQLRSAALTEWTDPIARRLDYLSRGAGFGGAFIKRASLIEDEPSLVVIDVATGPDSHKTIQISEARWADSFLPEADSLVWKWAATFSFRAAFRFARHVFRYRFAMMKSRANGRVPLQSEPTASTSSSTEPANADALESLQGGIALMVMVPPLLLIFSVVFAFGAGLVTAFLLTVALILILPVLLAPVALVLSVLMRVPLIGSRVRRYTLGITSFIGDAAVWTNSTSKAATMRDVVLAEVREKRKIAQEVFLLGHSQGAAICAQAALGPGTDSSCEVDTLITVGGANALLRMRNASLLNPTGFFPVRAWSLRANMRWVNFWATWDPVSSGPIVDDEKDADSRAREMYEFPEYVENEAKVVVATMGFPPDPPPKALDALGPGTARQNAVYAEKQRLLTDLDWISTLNGVCGPEERIVHNRSSMFRDHTTYPSNILQVIDPIARMLMGRNFEQLKYPKDLEWRKERLMSSVRELAIAKGLCFFIAVICTPWVLARLEGRSIGWQQLARQWDLSAPIAFFRDLILNNDWLLNGAAFAVTTVLIYVILSTPLAWVSRMSQEALQWERRSFWASTSFVLMFVASIMGAVWLPILSFWGIDDESAAAQIMAMGALVFCILFLPTFPAPDFIPSRRARGDEP